MPREGLPARYSGARGWHGTHGFTQHGVITGLTPTSTLVVNVGAGGAGGVGGAGGTAGSAHRRATNINDGDDGADGADGAAGRVILIPMA